jgi:DNA polymerase-3 subunit delta
MSSKPSAAQAPLVLAVGKEQVLVGRVIAQVVQATRSVDPTAVRTDIAASAESAAAELATALSPSLFGETSVIVVSGIDEATEEVAELLTRAAAAVPEQVRLVCTHPGGVKGKRLLEALRSAGAREAACATLKGKALEDAVAAEFRAQRRKATTDAIQFLVAAKGADLAGLLAAVGQLCHDIDADPIAEPDVAKYYSGIADVKGWDVSDALWSAKPVLVLERFRWALAQDSGAAPALVSAISSGLRTLLRFASAPRGMSEGELAGLLGVPPWRISTLRQMKAKWTPEQLARAARLLALADRASKGTTYQAGIPGGTSLEDEQAQYEIEKALLAVRPPRE